MNTPKLKALIVEDEMIFARQLEKWLKNRVSEIFVSTNSENGTYYLTKEKPDIIFLDNQLPGINGIDVIEFYKEKAPESILVLMSSVFNLNEISLALKKGADYVLNKRNEHEDGLNAIVEASIRAKSTGSPFWKLMQFIAPEKSTSSKRIVILEDEEMFSFQLSMILNNLSSRKKHTVLRFASAAEFIEYCAKDGVPDILFLDHVLEDGTSESVVEFLNKQTKKCKTTVISSEIDIDTAMNLNLDGVSEFILKNEQWQESIREFAASQGL